MNSRENTNFNFGNRVLPSSRMVVVVFGIVISILKIYLTNLINCILAMVVVW